ncbi:MULTISPECIES: universal stress protein [Providencia]|uniref:Universal stress protein n=1 Tax=Providencia heimbachae ATCC 35613 TaxID=1354272 RepID=A0A1B7K2B4_9GAMM|nr:MULTISPECIES: universal stress protein [Providencia]MBP6121876.1 universal stress protein [Providencia sp.]MDD9340377.1 universal stress protein [Providencia heimbachae]NIH23085.1 universal stress protein [Providencia heimbachae]OAT54290.1 universal stress protein F [Providencia heimbachae ATCC 35613]QCJ70565.1 universal stress protein UspA [Providencia heimbachae]
MYKKILVPIDITEKSLANLVLSHIQYLAEYEKSHIHFLAVIPTVPFYTTMGFGFAEKADSEQENVTKKLTEIIEEFKIPEGKYSAQVVMGTPRDEILRVSDEISADLIVIGSRRPGMATYFLGSTASMIIQNSKISVLTVRCPQ